MDIWSFVQVSEANPMSQHEEAADARLPFFLQPPPPPPPRGACGAAAFAEHLK